MPQPKKLIEVAMPIKEISAESVRDKSIRHGHISTLHLWWARRPLPVCRAVVFASLVPDPLDADCPVIFKEAVEILLGKETNPGDPYKPYDDIPYTSAIDRMEDNLRNRLLMFIGKFSDKYSHNEKHGKTTNAKDQLSDFSLIKWDNKNDEKIINKARMLIWVSHNSDSGKSVKELIKDFDEHYKAIKEAENVLYSISDRHILSDAVKNNAEKLQKTIETFLNRMPKVFDPFAGGGAIPLEAGRLGCRSYGNDINPVAHIIQKGSVEFPQKYGKSIIYSKKEFINLYGKEELTKWCIENGKHADADKIVIEIPNRLAFDVEYYAKKMLAETEKEIGHLYSADKNGKKPLAYYWARTGICGNPSCRAEVPLLKFFYLANTTNKQIYLKPKITGKKIEFEIRSGESLEDGWMTKGNLRCPVCRNTTDVKTIKQQFVDGKAGERMLATIWDGNDGKEYKLPSKEDFGNPGKYIIPQNIPTEKVNLSVPQLFNGGGWGITLWKDIFNDRQKALLSQLIKVFSLIKKNLNFEADYNIAISTYLSLLVDRLIERQTRFSIWHTKRETFEKAFQRHDIPIVLDYPESNPFSDKTGSAISQIEWISRYIISESVSSFASTCNNSSSGDITQFNTKSLDVTITDPPYYDAIPYADISDFFYIWLKKMLIKEYSYNFATPLTNKSDECTALKHHHNNNKKEAKEHFEAKLKQIFSVIERQTKGVVSIMFAHQSTEAWTTLCNSIIGSKMNITGSWAFDSEQTSAIKSKQAYLSSSVTVSCRPILQTDTGQYKVVKKAVESKVSKEVSELYNLGFRGADLLTACFGQAVSEFGKYEKVEKADGSNVTIAELLEMARESAFNTLLRGFKGDDFTKFYIGWLQLFGFGAEEHDTAMRITQIGLTLDIQDLYKKHILINEKKEVSLADVEIRNSKIKKLGEQPDSFLIDQVHKAMFLYKKANRNALLQYLSTHADSSDSPFWRVITSLCEVLPVASEDYKQAAGLLSNKDSLIRESKKLDKSESAQGDLFE